MPSHFFRVVIASYVTVIGISSAASAFGARVSQPETIGNWRAPARWSPASAKTASARPLSAESDLTGALPFVPVTPCRIVDTRGPAGTFGGPSLPASAPRNFPLPTGPCAGIPASVSAYSLNITVTNTLGSGFIKIYPQAGPAPIVSTLNYLSGQTLANAAIVPAGTSGGVTVVAGVSGTDLIIDINGYYAAALNGGEQLLITASAGGGAIRGVNASGDGVQGETAGAGSSGVYGKNTGGGKGVFGTSTSGDGVQGQTAGGSMSGVAGINLGSGNGVYGRSDTGIGGNFNSTSGIALQASGSTIGINAGANNSSPLNSQYNVGVFGSNFAANFGPGVYGQSLHGPSVFGYRMGGVFSDPSNIVNGVHGVVGISDTPNGQNPNAGVLGENLANGPGVYATSIGTGFVGSAVIASNTVNGGTALYAYGISSSSAAAVITNDSSTTGGDIIQGWNQAVVKFKVRTDGEVYARGAFHGNGIDYADRLPAERGLEPGDVVVIGHDGLLHRSTAANATDVAGVYSTKPAMVGDREEDESRATIPIALAGVIPVKVMDGNGAIRAGDLLVSSSLPGHAMRAPRNPRPGTVIGKAMQKLDHGMGEIEMLVMLR